MLFPFSSFSTSSSLFVLIFSISPLYNLIFSPCWEKIFRKVPVLECKIDYDIRCTRINHIISLNLDLLKYKKKKDQLTICLQFPANYYFSNKCCSLNTVLSPYPPPLTLHSTLALHLHLTQSLRLRFCLVFQNAFPQGVISV